MKRSLGALLLFCAVAGCGNWHMLRPTTANNVQVGSLTLYVVSAEYAMRGDRIKLVVVLENRTAEFQPFDPHWLALRGASGMMFAPAGISPPPPGQIPPSARSQLTYIFPHVPERETKQMALMVAETVTMQFAGTY
jgi:hypothetical protein